MADSSALEREGGWVWAGARTRIPVPSLTPFCRASRPASSLDQPSLSLSMRAPNERLRPPRKGEESLGSLDLFLAELLEGKKQLNEIPDF